jgi:peptide/nickel transport system substrate-binding protein
MHENYWSKILLSRVDRRRALAITGGTAASAALLAACGGDDGTGNGEKSSLIAQSVDTTKQAKRGGILKDRAGSDPPTLDTLVSNSPLIAVSSYVIGSLFQIKPGYLKPSDKAVEGDVVESWEPSGDGLELVMKLRPGIKWHNKAPVNGRAFDIDDLNFSWQRFSEKSANRANIASSANPDAPVISLTATDSRTVVMKLKEPIIYAPVLFANKSAANPVMMPKETDTSFNPRGDMIGTGPFVMANYSPSVGFNLKRHPEYYLKDLPLVDEIELPIISEYAAALSQFRAGNIYAMGSVNSTPDVRQEDITALKRDEPRIEIYRGLLGGSISASKYPLYLGFGWLPKGKSPFVDERVRQAISMSLERDLYIESFFNVSKLGAEGLPVETRWNSSLSATAEGWWLDPKIKDFGPNAKYYQYDLTEAKKLLAAAGYPNGFDIASNYVTGTQLGDVPKHAEVIDGMISNLGIRISVHSVDYATEYGPQYRDGRGQYEGWAYKFPGVNVGGDEAVAALANKFWSKSGVIFHGGDVNGRGDQSGDPTVDAMFAKARTERDVEKRRALVFDIQRHLAKTQDLVNMPGCATGFTMAWPCLGNFGVYQDTAFDTYLWLDQTKPPFRS